jgi:hypothetical protein
VAGLTVGGALTKSVNVFVAIAFRLSVALMVNVNVPVAVGVPLSTPAVVTVKNEGSVVPLSANE